MKRLIFSLLLLPVVGHAQTVVKGEVQNTVKIEGRPSFFFKVHGSGNLISFTLPLNPERPAIAGQNHLLDVTDQVVKVIPGPWDPVFIGGTNFMILPRGNDPRYITYELRELVKLWNRPEDSYIGDVPGVTGLYQSVGVLKGQGAKMQVRLIAENAYQNHSVQDFTYDLNTRSLTLDGGMGEKLCSEFRLKLPMISKDGQFLGGIDLATNKSAIWKINPDLSCTKVMSLPLKTGKLNFNYDNSKVTYHIYNEPVQALDDASDNYVAIPSDDFVSDIFVLDLKTNVTTRVTANRDTNSMYPDFTKDGRLVFINHPHDANAKVTFTFLRP